MEKKTDLYIYDIMQRFYKYLEHSLTNADQ